MSERLSMAEIADRLSNLVRFARAVEMAVSGAVSMASTESIELPRRLAAPRTFIKPPAGLDRRVNRALEALGDLPDGFDLPASMTSPAP